MKYDVSAIEQKWQQKWEEAGIFNAEDYSEKPKFYGLVEFPYPSGAGMHVGHIKAYSGLEVISRKRRMQGYNVLFPIGFDAFGLPTENYAIKTNIHPRKVTDMNIEKFTQQLKRVGFSFDWSRVVDTTDENYYKNENSVGWKVERLPKVSLAILRLALCEIMYIPSIPNGVSINEAVELAKKFSSNEDASFINGILGKYVRENLE